MAKKTGKTQYSILGWLSFGPKSAYDIKKCLANVTQHFWAESDGQLYPTLSRLQDIGAVELLSSSEPSARQRKVYQITDYGRSLLNDWLDEVPEKNIIRNEFLLKIFFADGAKEKTKEVLVKHLQRELQQSEDRLAVLKNGLLQAERENKPLSVILTIEYGTSMITARVNWVKSALKKVKGS